MKEVEEFLFSLEQQTYKNYEVILVDQNESGLLDPVIEKYKKFPWFRHIVLSEKGLSLARNIGLKYVTGTVIGFPDDDCRYPPTLLENISAFFKQHSYDILMGKTVEERTGEIVAGKPVLKAGKLSCIHFGGSSTTLFINLSRHNISDVCFDENFGIGAPYHAEEENDLVMRLLKHGWKGYYAPDINYVYHPKKDTDYCDVKRAELRGYALGALIAKHLFSFCGIVYFFKYNIARPLGGIILNVLRLNREKSLYYLHRYYGIWQGFIAFFLTSSSKKRKT